MRKKLMPFWIYFVLFVIGDILCLAFPFLYILMLPMLLVIVPVWMVVAYLIGSAVQQRSEGNNIISRIVVAFLCSFSIAMVFPVSAELRNMIKWGSFHFDSLCYVFTDGFWWTCFVMHFLLFWIGEEVKHYGQGHEKADQESFS